MTHPIEYDAINWEEIPDDAIITVSRTIVHYGPAHWIRQGLDRRWTKTPQGGPSERITEQACTLVNVEIKCSE